jgi:hypothetical protein
MMCNQIVLRQLGLNNTFKTIELNGSTVAEVERFMLRKMSTALTEAQRDMYAYSNDVVPMS